MPVVVFVTEVQAPNVVHVIQTPANVPPSYTNQENQAQNHYVPYPTNPAGTRFLWTICYIQTVQKYIDLCTIVDSNLTDMLYCRYVAEHIKDSNRHFSNLAFFHVTLGGTK